MATRDIAVLIDKETGDINNLRDKKLADSASQQSVASTDAIRMTTTTGEEVYIARDSFVQAIASVLNSNSQSTITTLFGADANGNHANINMANLASVLSVPAFIETLRNKDITSLTLKSGTYFCSVCTGVPTDGYLLNLGGMRFFISSTFHTTYTSHYLNGSGWTGWTMSPAASGVADTRYGYIYFANNAHLVWDRNTGKVYIEGTTTSGQSIYREL